MSVRLRGVHNAVRHQLFFTLHGSFCCLPVRSSSLWSEKRRHRDQMLGREDFDLRQRRIRKGIQDDDRDSMVSNQRKLVAEVSHLGRARRWEEALHVFSTEPQPNPMLCTAAIDACAKSLQQGPAWRIFKAMPKKTVSAYNILIALQGRMRRVAVAEDLLEDMTEHCLKPTIVTFTGLMTAYGMAHEVESALQTLSRISEEGMKIDRVAYGVALSACARAGDKERTAKVLECMATDRIKPDMSQLTSVIVSCAQSKDETRAQQAFEDIRKHGYKADVIAYTSFINCLSGPKALSKAELVLVEMRAACVEPDSFTYNAVLQLAISCSAPERFREILGDMEERGIDHTRETLLLKERAQEAFLAESVADASDTSLPEGWQQNHDPRSGHLYYWNEADPEGTTTWIRPMIHENK